ncbi:MAG: hypothetical protein IT210_16405 [Armatimonadetes bacterium]|nr:hypothetical protein [Armatimonadota bacterium]
MRLWLALCLTAISSAASLCAPDPMETLRNAPKPVFRKGHTLPPLTRWGWTMPYEVRVELAERWGYALELGGYVTEGTAKALEDPQSVESRLCALAAKDPKRYPLAVLTVHGDFGTVPESAWTHEADGSLPEGKRIWSPEAPDEIFRKAARDWSAHIRAVRRKAPIAMILNGGEYGLSVYGHHGQYWSRDPKVRAARKERPWFDYISARKARQEEPISNAFRQAVPDRTLYLHYYTDGSPHRNRYPEWWTWAWGYRWMRPISDIPNSSLYYLEFNSGWGGDNDLLTQALNAASQQIAAGDPLSYNWVCAGWVRPTMGEKSFSDPKRYMGFLKCLYTAGMTGAVAGYFSYPAENDPQWLWQMTALGHAHALFSHLEPFLRKGDLLPGPNQHRWSKDLPAYELPAGSPGLRLLARKLKNRPEWLVTAWAAEGEDRKASADVPGLGRITVDARSCGNVYRFARVKGKLSRQWMDRDGMHPTAGMATR